MSDPGICLGRVAILWRGDEAARRTVAPESSRFKAIFAALADVGVAGIPVAYEDDVWMPWPHNSPRLMASSYGSTRFTRGAVAPISTHCCATSRRTAFGSVPIPM